MSDSTGVNKRPPNLPIFADCVDHGLGNDLSGDDSWEDDVDGDVFFLVDKSVIFPSSVSRKLAGELDDAQVPEWEPCTAQSSTPKRGSLVCDWKAWLVTTLLRLLSLHSIQDKKDAGAQRQY